MSIDQDSDFDFDAWKAEWDRQHTRAPIVRTGEREPISRAVRHLVHQRDGFRCVKCGKEPYAKDPDRRSGMLHVDHIIPWSAGGSDKTWNLRTLCWECNERRSNYIDDMDTYEALPIVRICVPCLAIPGLTEVPAEAFQCYCPCRRHVSWTTSRGAIY